MISASNRCRLLAGVALGFSILTIAKPASAGCTGTTTNVANDTRTCATTVTTDTTGGGLNDRNFQYSVGLPTFLTIPTGADVTGYGLAWTTLSGGSDFSTTVTNNGLVQVDAGNLATAGGSAAFNINSAGATNVVYTGTGTVTNLGTGGNGLEFSMGGTGSLTANVGGNIRSAVGGSAIFLGTAGTGTGANSITTATGTTLTGDLVGAYIFQNTAGNASAQTLTNNSTVVSITGTGTLDFGVGIQNAGTGATTIVNNGAIGSATDRIVTEGIFGSISNVGSAAALSTSGTGAIFTAGTGIASNNAATTSALSTNTVN